MKKETLQERLYRQLVRQPNGCLTWTGCTNDFGYGVTWFNGKVLYAHRVAWALVNGPIPKGLHILHSCDNPPCCEPAHLRADTQAANNADMRAKGRQRTNGFENKTHCPARHPYDEANTYVMANGGRSCRACSRIKTALHRKQVKELT